MPRGTITYEGKIMVKKFKEDFIKEIAKKGYPVIVNFAHEDSAATIYAKSENEVFADDYGSQFIEGKYKTMVTIHDLSEEGAYKLMKEGIRPGETDFDYYLKEEGEPLEEWHKEMEAKK
jgi:hypothetical protein